MKEEPRPDSRSSATSAESDISASERVDKSSNNNNHVKIRSSAASSAPATPAMKSRLSFGISRLLDEPKTKEEREEETTDEEEEEDMQDGSSSPVTRSGSSHESSHHQLHPQHPSLTPENHNHHMPHAGSGPMYSYSPAFPWFGSYVGKEGIPSKFRFTFSCLVLRGRELNPEKLLC